MGRRQRKITVFGTIRICRKMFKKKLQTNQILVGGWITLAHPAIAEIMCNSGFDWIGIDLEHSVISLREAEELIRIIDLKGLTPLVRLTSNNPDQIKRVMDAGAHGMIVPMINTKKQAIQAVESFYYAPRGKRGAGIACAQKYSIQGFKNYFDWHLKKQVLIIQIEHIDAVNCIDEIFSVEGIDGYFIGPYDLSCSLGCPGDFYTKEFAQALAHVMQAAKKRQIPAGYHLIEPKLLQLETKLAKGYTLLAYSTDALMLDASCRGGMSEMKAKIKMLQ